MWSDPDSTVAKLLRSFLKTHLDWINWICRGTIIMRDGDTKKTFELPTYIDPRFFEAYGFVFPSLYWNEFKLKKKK